MHILHVWIYWMNIQWKMTLWPGHFIFSHISVIAFIIFEKSSCFLTIFATERGSQDWKVLASQESSMIHLASPTARLVVIFHLTFEKLGQRDMSKNSNMYCPWLWVVHMDQKKKRTVWKNCKRPDFCNRKQQGLGITVRYEEEKFKHTFFIL